MRGTERNIQLVCKFNTDHHLTLSTVNKINNVQIQGIQIHIYETLG